MSKVISAALPVIPAQVGYNADRLDVLDAHFCKLIDQGKVQGAFYAMSRNDQVFVKRAMGKASFHKEDARLCQPDSIRRIASLTKMFTATAILKLVEDGLLALNEYVGTYIEEFRGAQHCDIRIHNLLTHTSGLTPDGGVVPHPFPIVPWDIMDPRNQFKRNWIESYLSIPMLGKPGERWYYSSLGFCVLAELVKRISGMSIEEFNQKYFFDPLEMTDTYYDVPEEKWDRIVTVSERDEPGFKPDDEGNFPKVPRGGWGMCSTAPDLVKYGQMLCNNGTYKGKRILGRKIVERLRTNVLHNVPDFCWGQPGVHHKFGLGVEMKYGEIEFSYTPGSYGHEGAGFCHLVIDPAENFVAVWFASCEGWQPEAVINAGNIIWSGIE